MKLLRTTDLSAIPKQHHNGQQSLFKAVQVSFQSLEPEMQERYKALAVLLEDMVAPLSILQTLWNVDEAEARRTSKLFGDHSLAQCIQPEGSLRLDRLQVDYVRAEYPDKEALELIHGAVRLSSHVIEKDPGQFVSQMLGRLPMKRDMPAIEEFTKRVAEGAHTACLRPLQRAVDHQELPCCAPRRPRKFGPCGGDDARRQAGDFRLLGHHAESVGCRKRI